MRPQESRQASPLPRTGEPWNQPLRPALPTLALGPAHQHRGRLEVALPPILWAAVPTRGGLSGNPP